MSTDYPESGVLGTTFQQRAAELLASTDEMLEHAYPGDPGTRQPVHTVYLPADSYIPEAMKEWGRLAADSVSELGLRTLGELVAPAGAPPEMIAQVVDSVQLKLSNEPIEDLRLDFEDGFGERPEAEEDEWAVRAAKSVAEAVRNGTAPPFIGIRFKSFEAATRNRGLRTLDLFLTTLVRSGGLREAGLSEDGLPRGLILTLPKVSTFDQVEVMVLTCERLEIALGLPAGRLRFEVQMETAPMILGADGVSPLPGMLHRTGGRVEALHYGTYDYSDSLQIAAAYQSMEHPAADYAKAVMQVAVAGTGVRLSDGSTNILPAGDEEQKLVAWRLHTRLVRRSLERGYYQGWDLHPAQLPTRFLAMYFFYREGFASAALRLRLYLNRSGPGIEASTVADEPATARALARFVHRGVLCGAISEEELLSEAGVEARELFALAHPKASTSGGN